MTIEYERVAGGTRKFHSLRDSKNKINSFSCCAAMTGEAAEKAVKDFDPFGPEWEREMMKLPKKIIIEMLKNKCNKEKP
jgi:hypothetical protein